MMEIRPNYCYHCDKTFENEKQLNNHHNELEKITLLQLLENDGDLEKLG